jgi:hypothetical protein
MKILKVFKITRFVKVVQKGNQLSQTKINLFKSDSKIYNLDNNNDAIFGEILFTKKNSDRYLNRLKTGKTYNSIKGKSSVNSAPLRKRIFLDNKIIIKNKCDDFDSDFDSEKDSILIYEKEKLEDKNDNNNKNNEIRRDDILDGNKINDIIKSNFNENNKDNDKDKDFDKYNYNESEINENINIGEIDLYLVKEKEKEKEKKKEKEKEKIQNIINVKKLQKKMKSNSYLENNFKEKSYKKVNFSYLTNERNSAFDEILEKSNLNVFKKKEFSLIDTGLIDILPETKLKSYNKYNKSKIY